MEILTNEEELCAKVPLGAIFRHYKGKLYKLLQIARSSEDLSLQVVYQGLYTDEKFGENPIWVRPLNMFIESIETNGEVQPRFTLINENY